MIMRLATCQVLQPSAAAECGHKLLSQVVVKVIGQANAVGQNAIKCSFVLVLFLNGTPYNCFMCAHFIWVNVSVLLDCSFIAALRHDAEDASANEHLNCHPATEEQLVCHCFFWLLTINYSSVFFCGLLSPCSLVYLQDCHIWARSSNAHFYRLHYRRG